MSDRDLRGLRFAPDHPAAPAVVEQRVDRLLEHPLLVPDDDLRGVELQKPLEPVVAVDDPAIEVVQVGRREPAAVERHERAEIRRQHRDDRQDHPLRMVPRLPEGHEHLEPLTIFFRFWTDFGLEHLGAEGADLLVEVDLLEQLPDRLGAHARP